MEGIKFKDDGSQLFDANYSFGKLSKLKEIKRVEGVIGNDIDFSGSPLLNNNTYYRIVRSLSTTTQGRTITFSADGVDEAFYDFNIGRVSQEWYELTMERPNWNFAFK